MISYTKLQDGSWGIRSTSSLVQGEQVTVTTRAGETKRETVGRVLWSGNGIWICSVARSDKPARSGVCRECRGPLIHASHHRAMNGYCGNCAFDEFDM